MPSNNLLLLFHNMKEENYSVVSVKENILIENNQKADELRKYLSAHHIFFINLMASPGSGKTTLLVNIINRLKSKYNIGVMEADIDGDVDAERISKNTGVRCYFLLQGIFIIQRSNLHLLNWQVDSLQTASPGKSL